MLHLRSDISPVNILANSVSFPGIDFPGRSNDYVGLWHFEDAAQFANKTDKFNPSSPNKIRGMLYDEAGPNGGPGTLDTLIFAGAGDLAGESLDPGKSAGTTKYGPFDQNGHSQGDWENPTLGHVEFSALDSLAEYGWSQFVMNPHTVLGLAYPLHALGDAAEPHHASGTTAWGHRPYEDAVDDLLDGTLLPPPPSCGLLDNGYYDNSPAPIDPTQAQLILQTAYNDWVQYNSQFSKGQGPIRAMVQALAINTYELAQENSTIFQDSLSTSYNFNVDVDLNTGLPAALAGGGALTAAELLTNIVQNVQENAQQRAVATYEQLGLNDVMKLLLEESSAMTIAFLIGAAQTAEPVSANSCQLLPAPGTCVTSERVLGPASPATVSICLSGQCPSTSDGGESDAASCPGSIPCTTAADCENIGILPTCSNGCCANTNIQ